MKKIIFLFSFLVLFFFFVSYSFASESFVTDYKVTYSVRDDASTHVSFDISLTNTTSQYYASSYNLTVGFKNIQNISAKDGEGPITPNITKGSSGENVELTFNQKVLGLNSKLNFNLSFDTIDVAAKTGKVWEINIPGIANQSDFQSFNVQVNVPSFLGNPTYIKPEIANVSGANLKFNKEMLGKSGISITFGNEQIYKFDLSYHLQNSNLFPIKTDIALPPETNYQEVKIDQINPKPLNVKIDNDGNWLATYSLLPSQKLNINVLGQAKLSLYPKKEKTDRKKLDPYLKEQPYWQTNDKNIQELAKSLKTPFAIYEYAVKNLSYDFSRVTENKPRLGAINILKNPKSAVCLEFTDLFVALARAAGIPAREVDGFAYTQDSKERPLSLVKDILHAWPEYYDFERETWVMVDPTWGNTTGGVDYFHTLDFDHFAFVIKGMESNYPVPAGGYKFANEKVEKDVSVSFSNSFDNVKYDLSIDRNFSKTYFSGIPMQANIKILNTGTIVSNPQEILISANVLKPEQQKLKIEKIPPFGYLTVPLSFEKTPFLTNISDAIKITVGAKSVTYEVRVIPFFWNTKFLIGGILIAIFSIIISVLAKKSWRLLFFRRKG